MEMSKVDTKYESLCLTVALLCLCVGCSETSDDVTSGVAGITIPDTFGDPSFHGYRGDRDYREDREPAVEELGRTAETNQPGKHTAIDIFSDVSTAVKSLTGNALRDRLGEIFDRGDLLDEMEIIELMESLPVGNVSERALTIGVGNLAEKNPEMALNWLTTTSELSQRERFMLAEVAGSASGYKNPLESLDMASSLYQTSDGNSDIAVQFADAVLSSWVSTDVAAAEKGFLQLAEANPDLAAFIGSDQWTLSRMLEQSSSVGLTFGREVNANGESGIAKSGWFEGLGSAWVTIDPSQGMIWGEKELRGTALESFRNALVLNWMNQSPSDALNWVSSVEDIQVKKGIIRLILPSLSRIDPEGAHEWSQALNN